MSRVEVAHGPDAGLDWHFGDPVAEQRGFDRGVGAVALRNRGVVRITGPDRLSWLHSLTTQRFEGLAPGSSTTAYVLSPTGQIEHVLSATDDGTELLAWTEAGRAEGLATWLDSMRFMTRVEITVPDDLVVVWRAGLPDGTFRTRQGADSLGGHEVFVTRAEASALVAAEPAGVWAYEARRIAAGVPRLCLDTDDRTIPNELGVPSAAVELDKGCYRGQETVARVHNLGRPPRRLVRLLLDGSMNELPAVGSPVQLAAEPDGRPVGVVGTSALHHELGPIALALVKRQTPTDATLAIGPIAAAQEPLVDPEVGKHFRLAR